MSDVHADLYQLVRTIRRHALPRNRNFEAHDTPLGAAARRLDRFLRAVGQDLLAADSVDISRSGETVRLVLGFPSVRMRRVVSLTREEHALLLEDPRVSSRLSRR